NPRSPVLSRRPREYERTGNVTKDSPFFGYSIANYMTMYGTAQGTDAFKIDAVDDVSGEVYVGYSNAQSHHTQAGPGNPARAALFDIPSDRDFVFTSIGQLMHANMCIYSSTNNQWDQLFKDQYGP